MKWMSWALKNADPNLQAIMLAIYNQMRIEIDPAPDVFNSLVTARQTLIAAGKIDAEDAANLEAEASLRQQAGGDPAELVRLQTVAKIDAKYNAVDAKYGQHIFQGDFSGVTPTGYHSKIDGSATHQAYGTATAIGGGVYQQSVRSIAAPANTKTNQSTFFPDNATHVQIIRGIASVYEAGLSQIGHVHANVNGLRLEKRGDTVYPAGGDNTLLAE